MFLNESNAMNCCRKPVLLGLITLLTLPLAAQSLSSDRDQPVDIDADRFEYAEQEGVTHMVGNFVLVQGTLRVTADRATVFQREGEVDRVLLHGAPATLRQQLDADGGWTEAEAAEIDYLRSRDTVLLKGAVQVRQPRGVLRGETMTYDIASGRLAGGDDGGRVRMRIEPRSTPQP